MTAPLRILLLEDNTEDAEIVRRLLKKTMGNQEFFLATNKESYLQALDEFRPDVILSDNILPLFNGAEALKIVQERSLFIPFILVTGTVSDEFAANIIKSGADDYILKDRLTRLPNAIEAAVKQRRLEKEKKEAAEKLVQSEEKYRTLFCKSPLPKWIYDVDTFKFLEVNEAAIRHYGYTEQEFLNMTIRDIRSPEEWEALDGDLSKIPHEEDIRKSNWVHLKKNGERIVVETTAHFIEFNNGKARMVISKDITERLRAEESLRLMEKQVLTQKVQEQKKVTRAVIKAQENERNHIGRELHDNVNQILASAKMYLEIASEENDEVGPLIQFPLKLIEKVIQEIRELTHGYVVPEKNIDLNILVQDLLDVLYDNFRIKVSFVYNMGNTVIDDELKLNIYRIIQEQMTNIIKHADAKNVSVVLESANTAIKIVISDDGKGFDPNKKRKGIGISNMLNRIESFNGEMRMESAPGKGSTFRTRIPV
ncbi:MAG: PAS domain S-box protein [Flavitalea sp.]